MKSVKEIKLLKLGEFEAIHNTSNLIDLPYN